MEEISPRFVITFVGLIWGLHLMTRAHDYRRLRERFERAPNEYQARKYAGREKVFRVWGFVMTLAALVAIYRMYFV